ncbi:MAG: RRXRR domain-containing protein [Ruthenibacterium sp.]
MNVCVINKDSKELMPCSESKARHLLKGGKAVVSNRHPFTIQLLYGSSGYVQSADHVKSPKNKSFSNIKMRGNGDLFASLIAIVAVFFVTFMAIGVFTDVNTKSNIDHVARKYILQLETGAVASDVEANVKADMDKIPNVVKGSSSVTITSNPQYGNVVTLIITGKVRTTGYGSEGILGRITRKDTDAIDFTVTKQSTSKQAVGAKP